jgi:replicative DNA helicase Mcm
MKEKIGSVHAAMENVDNCDYDGLVMLRKRLNLSQYDIEAASGVKRATLSYWECRRIFLERYRSAIKAMLAKMLENESQFRLIERFATGDIGFAAIRKIEKVRNENEAWVYDVTVKPTQAFISECAVLHNTVSIAKAGIVATFRAKTAIVAAANPKFGRFQQNKHISEQFNIPPSLLSRFDLIFPILDVLDPQKDERLADHILNTHLNAMDSMEERENKIDMKTDMVDGELLRKYISYAKKNVNPKLTKEATDVIKEFYLSLRSLGYKTGSVPITPRYLEGLVRLAESNAG